MLCYDGTENNENFYIQRMKNEYEYANEQGITVEQFRRRLIASRIKNRGEPPLFFLKNNYYLKFTWRKKGFIEFIDNRNRTIGLTKKNFFFFTYASDYSDALSLGLIREFFDSYINKFHKNSYCVIVGESPDNEIRRNHFHGLIYDPDKQFNISVTSLDIKLKQAMIALYEGDAEDSLVIDYVPWRDHPPYDDLLTTYNAKDWAVFTSAHPNIGEKKNYGSYLDIFEYVTKRITEGVAWYTHELELIRQKIIKLDESTLKRGRKKQEEPDFQKMYNEGWTVQEVLDFLKKNYTNMFIKKYYQWGAGIHAVFFNGVDQYNYRPKLNYYIPNKLLK
eukprot:jgi/Orpsp1_1/1184873/evm.model.c7180000091341.1